MKMDEKEFSRQFKIVEQYLQSRGIKFYHIYEANDCLGVTYGRVSAYAVVNGDSVVDFIVD